MSLLSTINEILSAPFDKLLNRNFLLDIIRRAGIFREWSTRTMAYDGEDQYLNEHGKGGLWQNPKQIADLLIFLSEFKISTYLDIGTFNGWTCSVITAYLKRFNDQLTVTALDPIVWFVDYDKVCNILPITYEQKTSIDYRGTAFDFCFIDGDHDLVATDYEAVGQFANICAFHDIDDQFLPVIGDYWNKIKVNKNYKEFVVTSEGLHNFGIGILY